VRRIPSIGLKMTTADMRGSNFPQCKLTIEPCIAGCHFLF
jgi:hypothetical protein